MRSLKRQSGASFLVWLILIGLLGFGTVIGFRLIPIYLEAYTVDKVLEEVALESSGKKRNKHQIWSLINRRFDVNSVNDVKKENFSFTHEKGKTTIAIQYETRTKLVGNLDGVVHFEFIQTFES
jgi:hypothetical protein